MGEGGDAGRRRRYEEAVAAGAKPVPGGYKGKKKRVWEQRCATEEAARGAEGGGVRMRWDAERKGYVIEDSEHGSAKGLRALGTREAWRLRRAGTQAWVERMRPEEQAGRKRKRRT